MWKLVVCCVAFAAAANAVHISGTSGHTSNGVYSGGSYSGSGSSSGSYSGSSSGSDAPSYSGGGTYISSAYPSGSGGGYSGVASGFASAGGFSNGFANGFPNDGGYASTGGAQHGGAFIGNRFGDVPGHINPYEFHQQLTNQILAQQAATQQQIQANQAAFGFGGPHAGHDFSYGSEGGLPNLGNRFSQSDVPSGGKFHGVSSSSFHTSSDVDGKKQEHFAAETLVNDNGKVTSYRVHS